jgi:peptide-methionine (S)-S-oxide reductase
METIGFGGSCHWCTEAIFLSLKGIIKVQQGWIASDGAHDAFSEAVQVTFDPAVITLQTLVAIHLYTHSCTSNHSMRLKYRSAVYTLDKQQDEHVKQAIAVLQQEFQDQIITQVIPLRDFKLNTAEFLNYYYSNPGKPFCENIVNPKLKLLLQQFSMVVDQHKLRHLKDSSAK